MTIQELLVKWRKNGDATRWLRYDGKREGEPTPAGAAMIVCADELDALLADTPSLPEPPQEPATPQIEAFSTALDAHVRSAIQLKGDFQSLLKFIAQARAPDLVIQRLPDWNYAAFLNETDASCIAIGDTEQEALNNGMRALLEGYVVKHPSPPGGTQP
jgi:hypothetical protein